MHLELAFTLHLGYRWHLHPDTATQEHDMIIFTIALAVGFAMYALYLRNQP